jgi:hypothetical protein
MPVGHSTPNTVVLGEGVSKSKYTPYFGHHSCMQYVYTGTKFSSIRYAGGKERWLSQQFLNIKSV